ncbi:hypothetical protein L227DRAFT_429349 [Lentinus tigrinus ALCF2SS1-6]|uniref:Uncharacterized protein n=1 Tax=Lentinus tigrinus ALCF2SS1-6 TaxID=1328759 RepID=A0A5C2SHF3_9APHY|nr:hypothetical protein L227DRAFT_429349 [Lentinus tigrinus ALCF2SS1-6]
MVPVLRKDQAEQAGTRRGRVLATGDQADDAPLPRTEGRRTSRDRRKTGSEQGRWRASLLPLERCPTRSEREGTRAAKPGPATWGHAGHPACRSRCSPVSYRYRCAPHLRELRPLSAHQSASVPRRGLAFVGALLSTQGVKRVWSGRPFRQAR